MLLDMSPEVIIVGAGPAGLGTAASLGRAGVDSLVLESGDAIAPAWRARYDGFVLNTSSWFSYLPRRRFPGSAGKWPSRDALVAYYEDYAREHDLKIQLQTTVERVDRLDGDGWRLETTRGAVDAPRVVIATGKYRSPVTPSWRGVEDFEGELVHSSAYRNANPFRGRSVLVIGPGASGLEIATQIAAGGGRHVWVAVRTPPHLLQRRVGPFPVDLFGVLGRPLPVPVVDFIGEQIRKLRIGDLSEYGLDPPPDGVYTRLKRTGMVGTVDGPYVKAIKRRDIEIVAAVDNFDGREVVLADGRRLQPDAVIAATGFRRDLEPLVGHLGVLTEDGHPIVHSAHTHPRAPGLYFIGFTEPFSGNLRELRLDARRIARGIARQRRRAR
jgi:putative flavoprotein involved in K+ transport